MALSSVVVLLLCFVSVTQLITSAHAQTSGEDFISIDCGYDGEAYPDSRGILYSPDNASYISTGVNRKVSPDFDLSNYLRRYGDLRSFPSGKRNCYVLPVRAGKKYLVRPRFVYGNYDGLNQPPTIDLYLGVHFWATVEANDTYVEILAVAPASSMEVCLVNNGRGTPFISVLELRPLSDSMFSQVNASQSLVLHQARNNYGGKPGERISFPDDRYDRIWFTPSQQTDWKNLSINDSTTQVKPETSGQFPVPDVVIGTAMTTTSLSKRLSFTVTSSMVDKIFLTMHFSELQQLKPNESRMFDLYRDNDPLLKAYRPRYLQADVLYTVIPMPGGTHTYTLVATENSTLPPILNALEVFIPRQITQLPTDASDASAILSIKQSYRVGKNWEGDPCAPRQFMWQGLDCSFNASKSPRIISLNLSSNNLTGPVPSSLANLTALMSLDLSHNNLTGEIPGFLSELPDLRVLNLSNNQLSGTVPQALAQKFLEGTLLLSIEGNLDLCNKAGCTKAEEKKKKKNIVVPIIISFSVAIGLLVTLILIWFIKRARNQSPNKSQELNRKQQDPISSHKQMGNLHSSHYYFEFSKIVRITHNFEKVIGRGGFGTVYLADLPDKSLAAVKLLSQSSSQGVKEFQAEAQLLTRVHHKNLVSLLAYCDDMNNMALVYEYMPQGSLAMHLSGKSDTIELLTWRVRLTIAFDSAQGLDYLHNGCKPSILHRDVKTANILLSDNFRAKLADFGLSRAFSNEEATHLTTVVAGTPGYLDPEYQLSYRLNEKSDTYSFGVVLLEIITGKPPINGGAEKMHITQWVLSRIEEGDIDTIADHRMQRNYDSNSVWKAVDIAMACTSLRSSSRPSMSEVVVQLKECLAIEEERNYPYGMMRSPGMMETMPLNIESMISIPSAR